MKVVFLGTGTSQGVPVVACDCEVCQSSDSNDKRLRTSILVEVGDTRFVIDTGPDFRYQMLRENVQHIDAILYTHEHKDHIAGMDDVRAFNYKMKGAAIDIYATKNVEKALRNDFHYVFADFKYPGIPNINIIPIGNKPFKIKDIEIIPIEVMHYKLPVLGFRINDFTYITDANFISEKEKEKIKGSKVLVLNALRKQEHISHFTFDEALALMSEFNPQKGYLTHISHQLGTHEDISKELPDNVELAFDGLTLEL